MNKTVAVIDAGIHGMATGLLLADRGFEVKIIDMNDRPGGVARVYRTQGYTFDMGPTWYLMPEVFERYFHLLGSDVRQGV
ncbi:MAG: NAD(P)-binding protein [Spirochaetota bacterium]|nr:NAD(P)-binding protein [Spirochaetota bacterium]